MGIDTRKWWQTSWFVEPLQRIRILTYLVMIWPWPNLWSNIQIDLPRSKSICFEPAWRGKYDGVVFISYLPYQKNYEWKTISVKNTFFIWWPPEPKLLTLGQIWSANVTGTWRELSNAFSILPSHHTFGDNSDCLRKIAVFSKFDHWWPLLTSILTWPENDLSKSLRSRRALCYTV